MRSYEVNGFYGSGHCRSKVFCVETRNGLWYAVKGSCNVNLTYEDIREGTCVETISDIDIMSSSTPIKTLKQLEKFVQ